MKKLECIVFNVEHGLAVYIKSPNNYALMIDCGGSGMFSPVKWINSHYNITIGNSNKIKQFKKRNIAELKITHLHKDHFEDIGRFKDGNKPKHLLSDKKTIDILKKKIDNSEKNDETVDKLKEFVSFRNEYTKDTEDKVDYGMTFDKIQLSYEDAKEISTNDDKLINNRSFVFIIEYAGKKILIPGDIEVEGWGKLLLMSKSKQLLKGINFFIASHHGHKSGFSKNIINTTGKPDIFIVSARAKDTSVDSSYSKDENVFGMDVVNDGNVIRNKKMISTREFNKSIKITICENGVSKVETLDTSNNITKSQKYKIDKRTERKFK